MSSEKRPEQLRRRLDTMSEFMRAKGWQQFDVMPLDEWNLTVTADDFPSSDSREARNELYDACIQYLGRHGWKVTQLPDGSHEVQINASEVILPVMTDQVEGETAPSSEELEKTLNELRRKFEGVQWNVLALGAYIAHNIESDELRDVDQTTNEQTATNHLRDIIAAEFGVDMAQVTAMNAQLINSIGAGGVNVIRWSKQEYLNWMMGVHLGSIDYSLLLRLLFDMKNEETSTQARADE